MLYLESKPGNSLSWATLEAVQCPDRGSWLTKAWSVLFTSFLEHSPVLAPISGGGGVEMNREGESGQIPSTQSRETLKNNAYLKEKSRCSS